jgi:hypothetical protein
MLWCVVTLCVGSVGWVSSRCVVWRGVSVCFKGD